MHAATALIALKLSVRLVRAAGRESGASKPVPGGLTAHMRASKRGAAARAARRPPAPLRRCAGPRTVTPPAPRARLTARAAAPRLAGKALLSAGGGGKRVAPEPQSEAPEEGPVGGVMRGLRRGGSAAGLGAPLRAGRRAGGPAAMKEPRSRCYLHLAGRSGVADARGDRPVSGGPCRGQLGPAPRAQSLAPAPSPPPRPRPAARRGRDSARAVAAVPGRRRAAVAARGRAARRVR